MFSGVARTLLEEVKKIGRKVDSIYHAVVTDEDDEESDEKQVTLNDVYQLLEKLQTDVEAIQQKHLEIERIRGELQASHEFVQAMFARALEGSIERATAHHTNGHSDSGLSDGERLRRKLEARRQHNGKSGYAAVDSKAR